MAGHMQQRGEVSHRPAHAEGEGDDAHVLDGRVGEHALDVLLPPQQEGGDQHREQAESHQHLPRPGRVDAAFDQHLAPHHRIQRHVQQQAGQHRRDGSRSLGMSIGQPAMQRHQADLGAVAHQQEHEGDADDTGFELAFHRVEVRPEQGAHPLGTEHALRGEIQQHRAEQRQGDAHAAEDEVLPRGFKALRRAIERHQQHGGQRGRLHRHPENAHIVGGQRQQHGEHEQLIHAVVEPQPCRREPSVLLFDAHVGA
ncbi:hypothetical protein GALL_462000 [mine drainage metagenome]|uniref:Uncharacterized protein n=1 Tax=mine drainage metagenome TaxID=410659 RepID=A0A1J5Q3Y7_9ZZZZ